MKIGLCPRLQCVLTVLCLFLGCGKKAGSDESAPPPRHVDPVVTDVEAYLSNQKVLCEEGEVCPNYLVKVVAFNNKKPKICTGFLVSNKVVATSTSCLPSLLRLKDQDCSKDVTFFMPETNNRPMERVACAKVIQVSDLPGNDAAIYRDDLAFLELKTPVQNRRSLIINREGLENHKTFTVWGIEQQVDEKTAFIRRMNCESVHGSYVNPLSSKATSPSMLMAGCGLKNGTTGAPVLDSRGRVRAVVSKETDPAIRKYLKDSKLLSGTLKEMFHTTNFSCAATLNDTTMEDYAECTKRLEQLILANARRDMLARTDGYEVKRKALEDKVSDNSRFFNFNVKLVTEGDFKRAEITPKCFKNVLRWIYTLDTNRGNYSYDTSFPKNSFKRSIGDFGELEMADIDDGKFEFVMQFSVKDLKKLKKSDVHIWNNDSNIHLEYAAIPEC